MNEVTTTPDNQRNVWLRGLYMLLMAFALNVCLTVLCIVTLIQFVMVLLGGTANERLVFFGSSLGSYLQQVALFLVFRTEEIPFPFSEWPDGN